MSHPDAADKRLALGHRVGLAGGVPTIIEVDPHDEPTLRAFWEAEQAAVRADRDRPVVRTWDSLRVTVQDPSPYYRRRLLAAVEGDSVVGGADLTMSLQDNPHLGGLEINVRFSADCSRINCCILPGPAVRSAAPSKGVVPVSNSYRITPSE